MHVIDASKVAFSLGLGSRTNTLQQTCFFALSGVMPRDEAIAAIKKATEKTYARKGKEVIRKNFLLGARVPVILTSRADSVQARLASCAVASLVAASRRGDARKAAA